MAGQTLGSAAFEGRAAAKVLGLPIPLAAASSVEASCRAMLPDRFATRLVSHP